MLGDDRLVRPARRRGGGIGAEQAPARDPYVLGKAGQRLHLDEPPRARPPAALEEERPQRELLRPGQHGQAQIADERHGDRRIHGLVLREPVAVLSGIGEVELRLDPSGEHRPRVLQPFQIGAQQLLQHPAREHRHAAHRGDAEHRRQQQPRAQRPVVGQAFESEADHPLGLPIQSAPAVRQVTAPRQRPSGSASSTTPRRHSVGTLLA